VVTRQWLACAATLAGSIIARLEGHPWATVLTATSVPLFAALGAVVLVLKQRVSDRATDLIAEGRETLPIEIVQRQRHRLLARRRRKALAKALDTALWQATASRRIMTRGTRPLFDVRVIVAVAADIRAVIGLLQSETPTPRGVALIDQLITDGQSAFYGHEVKPLRDKLHHIRYALQQ
jgi:hypothetical protein